MCCSKNSLVGCLGRSLLFLVNFRILDQHTFSAYNHDLLDIEFLYNYPRNRPKKPSKSSKFTQFLNFIPPKTVHNYYEKNFTYDRLKNLNVCKKNKKTLHMYVNKKTLPGSGARNHNSLSW